jgi:geranylgeranyl pyrophosphate synthase
MDREKFAEQIRQVAPAVESALREWALPATDAIANLDEGVGYALGFDIGDAAQRGKRLRPALAVLTCEALGGQRFQVMPFAVAVELMHNYFLVHDDIEDGDVMRHGRPSVWQRFGLAHGINIGDYLHGRVMAVALRSLACGVAPATVFRLLDLLAATLDHTHRGQTLDINARASVNVPVEQYLAIVAEKTAHYLAAPVIGGAMVAGADDALLDKLRAFGAAVGPMYQIVDDLIDLTEGKGRGERGADIREGKRSFMVAYALSHLDPVTEKELLDFLDRPRQATSPDDVARTIRILEECGATEQARATIAEFSRRARSLAAEMPERLGRLLEGAADLLQNRTR